ncbi:MAG TPA: M20/M25/M40 family metallo-hydrolase [Candidatus Binatia bacterium]|nr:M20/M25/M40 family metallo-hydrolase [Candidatus Binatia bacterium]
MRMRRFCLLIFILAAGPAAAEPDWDKLTDEAAHLLSQYVQIDTTNPPGNELPAAHFLEHALAQSGIASTIYPTAENRGNLLARVPGNGKRQPVLLLHHMDVVPAVAADWSFPPFSGVIQDGFVYGRGSIDDKSHGIVQMTAVQARAQERRPCSRDIIFLAVADEEVGGEMGARFMVDHHLDEIRADAVWNEGGASIEGIVPGHQVSSVAVTEKNSLWITLAANGESGHGSAPTANGTITVLVAALSRIAAWETPIHLIPPIRDMFARVGGQMFFTGGFLLSHVDTPVIGRVAAGRLTSDRVTNGLVRNTIALTGLRGGIKHNVIPGHAEADLDVRLLPDQRPEEFLAQLTRVINDPRVTIEPVRDMPDLQAPSPSDTAFFRALDGALGRRLSANITVPGMLTGGSDCKSFRRVGIPCYGFQPLIGTTDVMRRIHGVDERLSLDNLRLGIQITYDTLDALCAE